MTNTVRMSFSPKKSNQDFQEFTQGDGVFFKQHYQLIEKQNACAKCQRCWKLRNLPLCRVDNCQDGGDNAGRVNPTGVVTRISRRFSGNTAIMNEPVA